MFLFCFFTDNRRAPSHQTVCEWVLKAWDRVSTQTVKNAFPPIHGNLAGVKVDAPAFNMQDLVAQLQPDALDAAHPVVGPDGKPDEEVAPGPMSLVDPSDPYEGWDSDQE